MSRIQAVMKAVNNSEGGIRACAEAIQAYQEAAQADERGELEVVELPEGLGDQAEAPMPEEPSAA
jgi:hypothetical protein